ncbi:MAG: T9SS type A sorting domain-containing protein [Bacteroidota bacterium]
MKRIITLFAILTSFSLTAPLFGQGTTCSDAIPIPFNATVNYSGIATGTFSNAAFTSCLLNISPFFPGGCTVGTCASEVWFQLDPNQVLQQNLVLRMEFGFTNVQTKIVLLYAESKDSGNGDPCQWNNTNSSPFAERGSWCFQPTAGATVFAPEPEGLDGSGTFFLVVQRETGVGGTVQVQARQINGVGGDPTCVAPSNDLCSSPDTLIIGNGIDTDYALGGTGSWADSRAGSVKCATKFRLQNECGGGTTEDTFWENTLTTGCRTDRKIGDNHTVPFGPFNIDAPCISNIDNSVFYTFVSPMAATDWYLHIGNITCSYQPNVIQIMIADNLNCNNADLTTIPSGAQYCGNANATFMYPTSDGVFGPLNFAANTRYWIIADGVQQSQCDFQMLLTRSPVQDILLPVEFSYVEGINQDARNEIRWATASEENLDYFQLEKSLDGKDFELLGEQKALGSGSQYQLYDEFAAVGQNYYRIVGVDLNGSRTLSETITVTRTFANFAIHEVAPVPMQDQVSIRLSTENDGRTELAVLDLAGREVLRNRYDLPAGTNEIELNTSTLPSGVYFLRFLRNGQALVKKVIKQ